MRFNLFTKFALIFAVLFLTYLYARYERNKIYQADSNNTESSVLKELPDISVVDISTMGVIAARDFNKNSEGTFVHIWGTWCAPCEKEMPDFLAYADKIKDTGIKFLLIAVNDEEMKIKKFLTRFPAIPKNVTFAFDKDNRVMDQLGTLKVPETFLFNKEGKHINKFIGPQDWLQESYVTRLNFWLNNQKVNETKIESH